MMSEKRFKLSKWCGMANHSCILDGDSGLMLQGEVVVLLNHLHEENEYLRNELKEVCNRDCDKCAEEWCDEIIDKYFEDD